MTPAGRVKACRIVPSIMAARERNQPAADGAAYFLANVMVVLEGDERERLCFQFREDEISFRAEEFIGLTWDECLALFHQRDVAYLRAPDEQEPR